MTCFHPLKAYMPFSEDCDGKRRLIFSERQVNNLILHSETEKKLYLPNGENLMSYYNHPHIILDTQFHNNGEVNGLVIRVPCGKCLGCRMDYARRWSTRCYNEAFMHNHFKNCAFLTLTFNNNMLFNRTHPWSVDKLEFSQFMKRFRKRISDRYGVTGVRFFACGEYGSLKGRPHYHALIFGFNFPDKKLIQGAGFPAKLQPRALKDGRILRYYHSDFLDSCWSPAGSDKPFGFATISDITYEDCAYTARYILKKTGSKHSTGREPEFVLSSRNPGLGLDFWKKYYPDYIANNCIDLGSGRITDIPRYYIDKLKEFDEDVYNSYKLDKQKQIVYNLFDEKKNETSERLAVKEELLKMKLNKFVRQYEFDSSLHNIY